MGISSLCCSKSGPVYWFQSVHQSPRWRDSDCTKTNNWDGKQNIGSFSDDRSINLRNENKVTQNCDRRPKCELNPSDFYPMSISFNMKKISDDGSPTIRLFPSLFVVPQSKASLCIKENYSLRDEIMKK